MKIKGLFVLIIIFFLLIIGGFIGFHNGQIVSINYLIAQSDVQMSWLLAITFLIGFIFNLLFFVPYIFQLKLKITLLNRKNKKLQQGSDIS